MKFWDTSAIIPLLVQEQGSDEVGKIFKTDSKMIVWWGTSIECISAISRLEREKTISTTESEQIIERLNVLRDNWREIQATDSVKKISERILRVHPLRAQDAQQLAACILANSDQKIEFVSQDVRLITAARKEGLSCP